MGAIAVAGATGAGAGGILAATGASGGSAFGALMKAGFVGFSGAAGTTAGLIGAGGSLGLSGSILAGGSAITPVAPTAVSSAALSTAPTVISGLPGATTGASGAFTASTPISGLTTASTGAFSTAAPLTTSSSLTGLSTSTSAVLPTSSFGLTSAAPASGTFSTTPITKAVSTTSKPGFLGQVGDFIRDGVVNGAKGALATVTTNTLLYGDPLGDTDGPDPLYRRGEGGRSFFGDDYSQLRSMVKPFPTLGDLGTDAVGGTYVTLLSNLNYGTGSRNYAINNNMALMKGIQVPQIQYA